MTKIIRITASTPHISDIISSLEKSKWQTLEHSAETSSLKDFIENENNYLLLAYESSEIVGMLIAYKLQKIDIRKIELLLYEIEVKRDFRKKGIATQLIEHLKEIGRKEGAHEIWVLMDIENKDATQLYDSTFQKNKKQIMYSINLK